MAGRARSQAQAVVRVEGLTKRYGSVRAVDGLSFEVYEGEIFGLLGPNGAGKTTTVECLEGLRKPDQGSIRVLGLDPWRSSYELRERIGLQLQEAALPDRLKVWEALDLFSAFYPKARVADGEELLARVGLLEHRDRYIGKLSGGQKQRLFVALALLSTPELVFLDELTTGLDPQGRRAMWRFLEELRARGTTIVLTTHYMEEAERLCDRVAILNQGRLVALDRPERLVERLAINRRLDLELAEASASEATLNALQSDLERVPGVRRVEVGPDGRISVYGRGERLAVDVLGALLDRGVRVERFQMERPSLEDVFLALTEEA